MFSWNLFCHIHFKIYDKLIYSPLFSSPQFEPLTESVENGNFLHKQFMKKYSRILLTGGELNLTNIKVFFKVQQVSQKLKKENNLVINDTHLMLRVLSLYCFVPASPSAVLFSRLWLVRGAFSCWVKNVSCLFFSQPKLSDSTDWSPVLLYPVWALKIPKSCKIVILIMIIISEGDNKNNDNNNANTTTIITSI